MTDAVEYDEEGKMIDEGIRTVRLRRVNRNLVIPEQVYLSMLCTIKNQVCILNLLLSIVSTVLETGG